MQEGINVMQAPSNISSLPLEENTFGRFVAQKLMSFDGYRKMLAEKKITELLFDIDYSMMTEGPSESGMTQAYQTVPQSVDAFGLHGPLRSLYHT